MKPDKKCDYGMKKELTKRLAERNKKQKPFGTKQTAVAAVRG